MFDLMNSKALSKVWGLSKPALQWSLRKAVPLWTSASSGGGAGLALSFSDFIKKNCAKTLTSFQINKIKLKRKKKKTVKRASCGKRKKKL